MSVETLELFRPVEPKELALIEAAGWRAFPPRLIFYLVFNEAYAVQIARDWDVPASGSGYVTRFLVRKEFVLRYSAQICGDSSHEELWVPAEEMEGFNANLVGLIEVIHTFPAAKT